MIIETQFYVILLKHNNLLIIEDGGSRFAHDFSAPITGRWSLQLDMGHTYCGKTKWLA